ncbi:hypothetical protein JCM10296v2_000386 [Rhodotorula toruloides]
MLAGLVDDLTAERARAAKPIGPVTDFHSRRPDTRVCSYVDVDDLWLKLMSEPAITANCLSLLRADGADEAWDIVSTISTRTRRSVALGVKVPVNLLPVLTGSLLFFAGGYSTVIDDLEYFRLCISRMYTLNRVPLRKILVAISLLNVSQKPLRLPDLFDPAMAADSDVMPDDIGWTNKAKTALASLQAKQRSGAEERTSGGACDKGIEAERSRTSASEARATGVGASDVMHTNYQAVLPTELTDTDATPTPTTSRASSPPPCSPTSTPPCAAPSPLQYPLVKLDALLYSRNHLRVCKSTELGVVFKMAWYGDDEVEELEHESAMYAELYRSPGASSFLAPYVGTYEWFGIRLAVVTGLGAEVEEWRRHRARKADAGDRAFELKELRLVLAGTKDEIDYEGQFLVA